MKSNPHKPFVPYVDHHVDEVPRKITHWSQRFKYMDKNSLVYKETREQSRITGHKVFGFGKNAHLTSAPT